MTYQVIYRRWRPQTFSELVGQPGTIRILQNALEQERLAHAYLFCGPRGTGKTSAAKILAKAVNCQRGPGREPCNECSSCLGIQSGRVMDVLEIDAASNRGIDEIRDLREKVRYAPTEARQKVYIIDEVHMLTAEAFNALLKTLEEPPGQVLFILATTEPHKLPATIISRCQRLDFKLIGVAEITDRLRDVVGEGQKAVSEEALGIIAEEAAGSLRDALSLLEQVLAYSQESVGADDVLSVLGAVGRDVFYDLTAALLNNNLAGALLLIRDVVLSGRDLHYFTQQAITYYRDLMVTLACAGDESVLGIAPLWSVRLRQQAEALGLATIGHVLAVLHQLLGEIRWASRPRLLWELALFRIFAGSHTEAVEHAPRPSKVGRAVPGSIIAEQSTGYSAPAPPQPAGGKPDYLAQITREWPRILEQLKKESRRAHACLIDGKPLHCDGNILQVEFPTAFGCEMMQEAANSGCLEKVISSLMGKNITVRCKHNGSTAPAAAENQADLASSALEIFRGRIVEDKS